MKRYLSLLLLCISLQVYCQPRLEIKDPKKNFGFVKKGEVVKLDYEIINKGTEPLLINDIEIGCSCTTADFDAKPILPQQSSSISISFDTHSVYDRQDRTVKVISNDPKGPHSLRYKGVVLR